MFRQAEEMGENFERQDATKGQKAQVTSIIHFTHCGYVACSLITMLAFSNKQTLCIDKEENKSCLLHIAIICPPAQLPKSASGKRKEKIFIHQRPERENLIKKNILF